MYRYGEHTSGCQRGGDGRMEIKKMIFLHKVTHAQTHTQISKKIKWIDLREVPRTRPASPNHSINVSSCYHYYGSKSRFIAPTPSSLTGVGSYSTEAGEEGRDWGAYKADWNSSNSTVWFELLFLATFTPNLFPRTTEQLQKVQAKVRIWICVSGSPPTPHLWKLFFGADTGISRVSYYFYIFIVSLL